MAETRGNNKNERAEEEGDEEDGEDEEEEGEESIETDIRDEFRVDICQSSGTLRRPHVHTGNSHDARIPTKFQTNSFLIASFHFI